MQFLTAFYCETDSPKLKGFIVKDVQPIAFQVGDN